MNYANSCPVPLKRIELHAFALRHLLSFVVDLTKQPSQSSTSKFCTWRHSFRPGRANTRQRAQRLVSLRAERNAWLIFALAWLRRSLGNVRSGWPFVFSYSLETLTWTSFSQHLFDYFICFCATPVRRTAKTGCSASPV